MKRGLVLTSIIAIGVIGTSYAETFPSDGAMQENKTYEDAATYTNMGVYDGTVTATAEYTDTLYQIMAGTYLPASSETSAACTSGNYCPGMSDVTYSETENQGLTACPSGYPNSTVGASKDTQCYTSCSVANANILHAKAVSGNDYYGTGTDTCYPTACDNGYHTNVDFSVVKQPGLFGLDDSINGVASADSDASGNVTGWECDPDDGSCSSNSAYEERYGQLEPNTWATEYEYGVVYGRASCQESAPAAEYIFNNLESVMTGEKSIETFRSEFEPLAGPEKTEIAVKLLAGMADGSMTEEDAASALFGIVLVEDAGTEFSTTSTGGHCFCQVTGFTPASEFVAGMGPQQSAAYSRWVFYYSASASNCASACADYCGYYAQNNAALRSGLFGSVGTVSAGTCDANEISITWTDADPQDVSANNAGMCTYDGDIRTPFKAATKPGKTFKGWRFQKS